MTLSLPAGYDRQPASGFHDPTGRFSYEFVRVYGAWKKPSAADPSRELDQGLSHWSVTWPDLRSDGDERPAERSISFTRARELSGGRLSFARFSSELHMRDALPGWLRPGEPA